MVPCAMYTAGGEDQGAAGAEAVRSARRVRRLPEDRESGRPRLDDGRAAAGGPARPQVSRSGKSLILAFIVHYCSVTQGWAAVVTVARRAAACEQTIEDFKAGIRRVLEAQSSGVKCGNRVAMTSTAQAKRLVQLKWRVDVIMTTTSMLRVRKPCIMMEFHFGALPHPCSLPFVFCVYRRADRVRLTDDMADCACVPTMAPSHKRSARLRSSKI